LSRYRPRICLEELKRIPEDFRIADVPVKIQTEDLPNASLEPYRCPDFIVSSEIRKQNIKNVVFEVLTPVVMKSFTF
jgi:hypothetical protein